ncbi:MAG: hypothetical protein AB8U25_01000 [Rickettsiales endosymbiont of Dermacentor nuttalli]
MNSTQLMQYYQAKPAIAEDIMMSFMISGSSKLERFIKAENLNCDYLESYKLTKNGIYFKPKA